MNHVAGKSVLRKPVFYFRRKRRVSQEHHKRTIAMMFISTDNIFSLASAAGARFNQHNKQADR
jgi:hypothetical protein